MGKRHLLLSLTLLAAGVAFERMNTLADSGNRRYWIFMSSVLGLLLMGVGIGGIIFNGFGNGGYFVLICLGASFAVGIRSVAKPFLRGID